MKSNQSKNLLTVNVDKLRDILGVSLTETNIKLPKGTNVTALVDKLLHDITDDFDTHVMSVDSVRNNYRVLTSLIINSIHNNLIGRYELIQDKYLMNAVVSAVTNITEEFCNETLKKFVTQDEWAATYKEQWNNKPFSNHPWSQVKGFNQNTGTFDKFDVPNRSGPYYPWQKQQATQESPGNPPGGSRWYPTNGRFGMPHGIPNPAGGDHDGNTGFPPNQHPGMFGSVNEYMEYVFNHVTGLEKNLIDLSTGVGKLADKLDKVTNQQANMIGFENCFVDLVKSVAKLNKEMEILSSKVPQQESSDVVVTEFKEGGSYVQPEKGRPMSKEEFLAGLTPPVSSVKNDETNGVQKEGWDSIKSVSPETEAYVNK